MNAIVEWQLRLLDSVSAPARRILEATDRLERQITGIDRQTDRLGRSYQDAGLAGVRSARTVSDAYGQTESRMARLTNRVRDMVRGTVAAVGALSVAGTGAMVRAAIQGMSDREGSLQSLGTLLKTQNQAEVKAAAAWIGQFADVTPFEDPAVMGAVRQLLASQFGFGDTKWLAGITGDAASALGNNAADAQFKWEIINRALGQIKAKGRVQGDELLQLQEAGIGTNAYLEKYVGKNYRDLMQKGQLSATAGLNAILRGLYEDYGGSMDKMSKTFSGMMSTLASRPKRIFSQMFDQGGLDSARRFIGNLVDLTDFSKEPGKRILTRLSAVGAQIVEGIFGPLAAATEGNRATETVERLLDSMDAFGSWVQTNGPAVRSFWDSFTTVLGMAWSAVSFILTPVRRLLGMLGIISENDSSGLAKTVGYILGAAVAVKLLGGAFLLLAGPMPLIFTLLGGLSLLSAAVPMLVSQGVLTAGMAGKIMAILTPLTRTVRVFAVLTGGWRGALLGLWMAGQRLLAGFLYPFGIAMTRAMRLMAAGNGFFAALRGGLQFASRFGWIARVMPIVAQLLPLFGKLAGLLGGPVGWVLTIVSLGYEAYKHWEPFRNMVNGIWDGMKGIGGAFKNSLINAWNQLPEGLRNFLELIWRYSPAGLMVRGAQGLYDYFTAEAPAVAPVGGTITTTAPTAVQPKGQIGGYGVLQVTNNFSVAGSMDGQAVTDINDAFSTLALEGGMAR